MRAVLQRCHRARVLVDDEVVGHIGRGVLALVGVHRDDTPEDAEWLARRIANLRYFPGDDSHFARTLHDVGGAVLVVSQFTLYGDCRKGRRPSFSRAMAGEPARLLVDRLTHDLRERGLRVETGRFGAMMHVELVNWGPVTFLLDSRQRL